MKHVVMFSGGVGSWYTARRVAERHGTEELVLLFADTKMEDADLYRFLDEAATDVGGTLVKTAEGRTPWEVFFDVRYLGNTRVDPCSRILKREHLRKWLNKHCDPVDTVVYIGIDWTEEHRYKRALKFWSPWKCEAPLCEPPLVEKKEMIQALQEAGIRPPRLYDLGFPHNNCGGFCIKAGMAHFRLLLEKMPERYKYHEEMERKLQCHLGKNRTILRDRRKKATQGMKTNSKPISLRAFRKRIEEGGEYDEHEWGGCGCFTP